MGRAMIIITAGVLISMGFIAISSSNVSKRLVQKSSDYAKEVEARNSAHTAIQIAFEKMNDDTSWAENHQGKSNAWTSTIDGSSTQLYLDYYFKNPDFWEPDSLGIVSEATFLGTTETIRALYLKNPFNKFVPDFKSPLSIATDNFNFNAGGSAGINGNAPNGCTEDKSAVTTMTGPDSAQVHSELNNIDAAGANPLVAKDNELSYQPTDKLIARLKNSGNTTNISGNYKGDMGTQDEPGVFFVEEDATLSGGIDEGYGILVIRSSGALSYEDSTGTALDIAGNFTFNGLVVFENAYNFDGRGTPTINGSVLVGNTEDSNSTIDIDITGNLQLQYDCKGEDYAKMAAAMSIKQNKFTRVVTYE